MKLLFTIILSFSCWVLHSQNWSAIDNRVATIDASDPGTLSNQLTAGCTTEKEKVRAIFRWITQHISYHRPSSRSPRYKDLNLGYQPLEDTGALPPLTERIAIKVLKDRSTHCEGFSRLFQSLCDHAGITAHIITGYGRAGDGGKFKSNHSWNAVWLDSSWHLLDVTWAAGHITYTSSDFVQHFDDYYFLTPPASFARHHYPDDLRWTLLASPPPIDELRRNPFRQRSFGKYPITDFYPSRGVIETAVGDTIRLELEMAHTYRTALIAPDSLWDSAAIYRSPAIAYVQPEATLSRNKIYYSFPVESDKLEWLHLMYNNDAVLRYRVVIQKEKRTARQ